MNNDQIILVDANDQQIDTCDKYTAHKEGLLHRAFSIFLCRFHNNCWETLLQQRHAQKYHSANLWSNSCCSHPQPHENILQAANRRLKQELNTTANLKEIGHIIYREEFSNHLVEHEYDHILLGIDFSNPISFNPHEISYIKWVSIDELNQQIIEKPDHFTAWLLPTLQKIEGYLNKLPVDIGKCNI